MRRISKDKTKHYQMACSSGELHAILLFMGSCFLCAYSAYFYDFFPDFSKHSLKYTTKAILHVILIKLRCS